jgi:hypothetical protein
MRLEEYIKDFHSYLTEIKFSYDSNSPDISRIGRGRWSFSVDGDVYMFRASPITMKDGRRGFIVEWGLTTPNGLSTDIQGNKRSKIFVFRNVLSCLAKFIEEEKPEVFSMYVSDKLIHIYDAMWAGHYKDKPFNQYCKDEEEHKTFNGKSMFVHYFTKKMDEDVSENDKYEIKRKYYGTENII